MHADDLDRLRDILPRVIDEARRALDAELETTNRGNFADRMKIKRPPEPKITAPEGGWQIQILENTEEDTKPGDIVIHSELGLPAKPQYGTGSMTKRIATRRMGGTESVSQSHPAWPPADAYAVIEYQDNSGRQTYRMTKDEIVWGAAGAIIGPT